MTGNLPDFSFAFQPIVNVETRTIVSFETLARGPNNEPAYHVFKQVSEQDKYIFDELLRERAVAMAAKLGLGCKLNLNFLPRNIETSETAISSTLETALAHGLSANQITIEVTETEIIQDVTRFSETINAYRSTGVNISIDDFGAGYSGLNLLAEFQPDSLKIDMSLIRDIHRQGPRQAIVRGIIRTCIDLGIDIIGEGVETEDEYDWCYDEGIELFQGYFFAKPGFEHLPIAFYPG